MNETPENLPRLMTKLEKLSFITVFRWTYFAMTEARFLLLKCK